ncbi:MAG: hypothetical protein ACR2HZ_11715 [Gemmatimonadaceae bacterium]
MPEEVVFLGFSSIICGTLVIVYALKAWSNRGIVKGGAALPKGVDQRLERIEHAVDAIAIEVERISEGQRFTTRLLSDRAAEVKESRRLS